MSLLCHNWTLLHFQGRPWSFPTNFFSMNCCKTKSLSTSESSTCHNWTCRYFYGEPWSFHTNLFNTIWCKTACVYFQFRIVVCFSITSTCKKTETINHLTQNWDVLIKNEQQSKLFRFIVILMIFNGGFPWLRAIKWTRSWTIFNTFSGMMT